jgi:hypothetical protein
MPGAPDATSFANFVDQLAQPSARPRRPEPQWLTTVNARLLTTPLLEQLRAELVVILDRRKGTRAGMADSDVAVALRQVEAILRQRERAIEASTYTFGA